MRSHSEFRLVPEFEPRGDQPKAIAQLVRHFKDGQKHQTLLGVTGSGKTFTMAHVIEALNRPTLIISHNKTLAAQLYSELKQLFPHNAVSYFVSYYDYYQPEAYLPARDIYIEKDASINKEIDRLRLQATANLMSRRDVIIVASVSCIYGLGSPEDYKQMYVHLRVADEIERDAFLKKLVDIQYRRNDRNFARGCFRVRGDTVEIYPTYEERAFRIEMFGDEIEQLHVIDALTGDVIETRDEMMIYPAKHFVMPESRIESGMERIEAELEERLAELKSEGKLLEAQRLEARTRYDMEMLLNIGYCPGIENYSRPLSGREPGSRPYTLIDYFPDDFLMMVDESHVTIPQIRGMSRHDRTRKGTLIEHGFRLKSALDNRPMTFEEWEEALNQVLFVSATPEAYELEKCHGEVAEQVIRPTGLVDPVVRVKPARGQVKDLMERVRQRTEACERVLVTTLTKRMAEDLSEFLSQAGIRVTYLHSEIDTIERVEILNNLRRGEFDVLVGVNLLREGLDLPEVSLVAILDADKEGFLRSGTSLIQTIGRTARNVNAEVILYGDTVTPSMRKAIDETHRRRAIQQRHNERHGITPETIRKAIRRGFQDEITSSDNARLAVAETAEQYVAQDLIKELEDEMRAAAERLEFEQAAALRDRILEIQSRAGLAPDTTLRSSSLRSTRPWKPKKVRRGRRGSRRR